jgi:uncharacterized membrane protein
MKQSKLFHLVFPFIMMAIPWIYLAIIWKELPATIPTHFGLSGEPDKFGTRNEILLAPAIFTPVAILMYFMLRNIHRIDPKRKYTAETSSIMSKIAVVMIIFLAATALFVTYWTLKGKVEGLPILLSGIGLFLAYMGNLMHSIKPNYFAGFRVPWALENEDNWRLTHQLASKIWFVGGLVLAVVALVVPLKVMIFVFIGTILVMTIIPVMYSYNIYRKMKKDMG